MNTKNNLHLLAAASLLLAVLPSTSGQTIITKTETFDSAVSAATNGWWEWLCRTAEQNFGFTNSASLGAAGEAGGVIARATVRANYADVFGGSLRLTLDNPIAAKGKIIVTQVPASGNASVVYGQGRRI